MLKTILIADDNSTIRYLLRFLIENAGFKVCAEAEDGAQAIEKAKQTKPDLILLDLSMPNMSGAEASPVLKRMMPRVPIIVFTLHDDSFSRSLAAAVGADLVISKADGMNKLVKAIHDLVNCATEPPTALGAASKTYSVWIGRQVVLQVEVGPLRVPLRGQALCESSSALRIRLDGCWDVDIFKEMIVRVEADNRGVPEAA
ncbi:MAG TPA: response regulator [Candidatus Acidoferrum sp.]|jgi:two-component system chemotaxis response regulator CheY